jgi:type III secretion system SsaH family protein
MNSPNLSNPRRLLLECAFAAANHGIRSQLEPMLQALPLLLKDEHDLTLATAFLLAGSGRFGEARAYVESIADTRAKLLYKVIDATASWGN